MNQRDLTLLTDFYELTMMQGYYEKDQNEIVIFDVFRIPAMEVTQSAPDWNRSLNT